MGIMRDACGLDNPAALIDPDERPTWDLIAELRTILDPDPFPFGDDDGPDMDPNWGDFTGHLEDF